MTPRKPFKMRGAGGSTIEVPAGEYYFNTKACCRRMMLDSLSSVSRQVYACLEMHSKGYRKELAVTMENGKQRRLTVSHIAAETKLDTGTIRRALRELEAAGLVERRAINPERPMVKGNVGIYCFASPHKVEAPKIEGTRALNCPTWFPEDWEALRSFFKRSRVAVDPGIEGTRALLLEGEKVARALQTAEKGAREYADRVRAQSKTTAPTINERNERTTTERTEEASPAAAASSPPEAAAAAPFHEIGPRSQEWLDRQGAHDAIAEEVLETFETITPILEAFRPIAGGITDSRARRLLKDCGGATPQEIAARASELIPGIKANKHAHSPVAILTGSETKPGELPRFFHSPAALKQWRREREVIADREAVSLRRAEESLRHSEEAEARQREEDARADEKIAAMGPEAFECLVQPKLAEARKDHPTYTPTAWRAIAERAVRRELAVEKAEGAT